MSVDFNSEDNQYSSENETIDLRLNKEMNERIILANKLIGPTKLSVNDKCKIYKYLTGHEVPAGKKRGIHTQMYCRDLDLAIDYLEARSQNLIGYKEIIKTLGKKYKLRGLDDVQYGTFQKAFNKGLRLLESSSIEWIDTVKSGCTEGETARKIRKNSDNAEHYLALIKKYKDQIK